MTQINTTTNNTWQPYREPLWVTVARTGTITLVVGAVVARGMGGLAYCPIATLLILWPAFGEHWIEVAFRNYLRRQIPFARPVQVGARLATWFFGGVVLLLGMKLTAIAFGAFRSGHWPAWWIAGVAFIAVELGAHIALMIRGRASFYNGRG